MVRVLNEFLPYPLTAEAHNTSVKITDSSSDGFRISGSVVKKLGFRTSSYRAKGKIVFPPWKIVKQRNFVGYKILLSKPYYSDGVFDVSYTAEKSFCRRCSGN